MIVAALAFFSSSIHGHTHDFQIGFVVYAVIGFCLMFSTR